MSADRDTPHTYRNPVWVAMRDRATLNRFAYDAFDHEQRLSFASTLIALEALDAQPRPSTNHLWLWEESR
jgi:hypothetical protein